MGLPDGLFATLGPLLIFVMKLLGASAERVKTYQDRYDLIQAKRIDAVLPDDEAKAQAEELERMMAELDKKPRE